MTAAPAPSTALAQNWCALSALHEGIADHIERRLEAEHGLTVREFSLLTVLSRQIEGKGEHLQMRQVAEAIVLSQSATTRLVTRMEDRGLLKRKICADDRRGIYTDVTEAGHALLEAARPTHDRALAEALERARRNPDFKPLVEALERIGDH
ncbi:MarR family transcriptional regulator [Glycomyces sp. TRM65418]|uniref:MarR family winged helix-turn-helix transcriptional regulator n=1 Tax=Glycomyces sp. TRM65418 TaxID=2867006 RepID=UPI001CE60E91|nr:MarR family transcriptional regulator [Glycomyces sp. TRM65418]MCC3763104.1 MarR family transcriptional regulator [Glycomyces sp. TRM65418]QZD57112.1 MarR family transcriptional regulator [Glycomyces sp. TRM65418]